MQRYRTAALLCCLFSVFWYHNIGIYGLLHSQSTYRISKLYRIYQWMENVLIKVHGFSDWFRPLLIVIWSLIATICILQNPLCILLEDSDQTMRTHVINNGKNSVFSHYSLNHIYQKYQDILTPYHTCPRIWTSLCFTVCDVSKTWLDKRQTVYTLNRDNILWHLICVYTGCSDLSVSVLRLLLRLANQSWKNNRLSVMSLWSIIY